MSLPGLHAATAAWLFLLLVPLVLFYFLKLRRPPRQVSSLVLWLRVLEDHRVNSPFQRFRRNLLLWLQVLLLVLLVLAAMRPFVRGEVETAERLPILVDCSASMAALDESGGRSRLDAAKEEVRKRIEGLGPGQKICLISFSRAARRRTAFTADQRLLLQALDRLRVEDVESAPVEAFRMAQALGRTEPFDEVLLVTDGNLPASADFELPFTLNYLQLPPAGANLGITALSARRTGRDGWEVFARVEASEEHPGQAFLELVLDGRVVDSTTLSVKAGRPRDTVFTVRGGSAALLAVRLTPDGFDALAADDIAYLELQKPRPLVVAVAGDLTAVRHAVRAIPDLELAPEGTPDGTHDLVITDRDLDAAADAGTVWHLGRIPGELAALIERKPGESRVVDWDRSSSVLQHVDLMEVAILERLEYAAGVTERDLEERGYRVLVHGNRGPLMLVKRGDARDAIHLLFHPDRSTLPYRIGFPVLVANLIAESRQRSGLARAEAAATGVLSAGRLAPDTDYRVTAPDGDTRGGRSDAAGRLAGIPAMRAGEYAIASTDGKVQRRVGAALLSTAETRLHRRDRIQFREGLSVSATEAATETDRPLWYVLAVAAFLVLLVEWWVYQRRPGGI